jgi:hypothetical protein
VPSSGDINRLIMMMMTSEVFLTAVILVKRICLGGISKMPLLPLRGSSVSGMFVLFTFVTYVYVHKICI